MTKTFDIASLVKNTPLLQLSNINYGSKMIEKLQEKFTNKSQQTFVLNFYGYLNYKNDEFVIELQNIWKWLGYSRIDNCKVVVIKECIKDAEYRIDKNWPSGASLNGEEFILHGGQNKEKILLTIKGFKKLCLKSSTAKSKEIREYYISLEEIMFEMLKEDNEEFQNKLLLKDREIENKLLLKDREIEIKNKTIAKLGGKRAFHKEQGQFVYLFKMFEDQNDKRFKGGESALTERRMSDLRAGNPEIHLVYEKACINSKLTEKVIHHVLDKYRIEKNREYFEADLDFLKKVYDKVVEFLDLPNYIPIIMPEPTLLIPNPEKQIKSLPEIPEEVYLVNNPVDYAKFITDCCEIDPDFYCIKNELYGMHKLWSRCNNETYILKKLI